MGQTLGPACCGGSAECAKFQAVRSYSLDEQVLYTEPGEAWMPYSKGEKVKVWCTTTGAWSDGMVLEAFASACEIAGVQVPAGTFKVQSEAGTTWILQGDVIAKLQKLKRAEQSPTVDKERTFDEAGQIADAAGAEKWIGIDNMDRQRQEVQASDCDAKRVSEEVSVSKKTIVHAAASAGKQKAEEAALEKQLLLVPRPKKKAEPHGAGNDGKDHLDKATGYFEASKFFFAKDAFSEALRQNPSLSAAWAGRGGCNFRLGNDADALSDLNKALEIDPARLFALRDRGELKLKTKDYDGAIEDYSMKLTLAPGDGKSLAMRGEAKLRKGDKLGAIADLELAIRIYQSDEVLAILSEAKGQKPVGK